MEAATLPKKKLLHRGNLKKTLKNVLCRPDPIFWPVINEEHKNILEKGLIKYKVDIPKFQKLHWNDLKLIPKEERPKQPPIKRVNGLIFGITECSNAIKSRECATIIIEADVKPRIIVQPLISLCVNAKIPFICLVDLRTISSNNFGIPTSCLGIKHDYLEELTNQVIKLAKYYETPTATPVIDSIPQSNEIQASKKCEDMSTDETQECPYLFRTDKKIRVFVPSNSKAENINHNKFVGQGFIKVDDNPNDLTQNRKTYMKMFLKQISNNPDRKKIKK